MTAQALGPIQNGVYVLPVPHVHPGRAYMSHEGELESKSIDVMERLAFTRRGVGGEIMKQYIPPQVVYEETMRAFQRRGEQFDVAHKHSMDRARKMASEFLARDNPAAPRAAADLQRFMSTVQNVDGYPITVGASGYPNTPNIRTPQGARFGGLNAKPGYAPPAAQPDRPGNPSEATTESYSYVSATGQPVSYVKGRRFPNGALVPKKGFFFNLFLQCAAEFAAGGNFATPLAAAGISLVDDEGNAHFDFKALRELLLQDTAMTEEDEDDSVSDNVSM